MSSKIGEDVADQLECVDEHLLNVTTLFRKLDGLEHDEVVNKLSPLDRAKYDLTILYAVNSLFWMYLRSIGEDPKTHPIKHELDRIKQQILRVKQIADKEKMPRIDQAAANRMVRHELWVPKNNGTAHNAADNDDNWEDDEQMEVSSGENIKLNKHTKFTE